MRRAVVVAVAALAVRILTADVLGQTQHSPNAAVPVGTPNPASVHSTDLESVFRVRLADAIEARTLRRALVSAAKRLTDTRCQTVLSEFNDERGNPLADALASLAVDAPRYLTWLYFRDASRGYCDGGRLAVTTPGSRVVYVCGRSFERTWRENSDYAEAMLIHEMLHSLGLGENPPSSDAITRRVQLHCAPS